MPSCSVPTKRNSACWRQNRTISDIVKPFCSSDLSLESSKLKTVPISSYKPAILDNGVRTGVPPFVGVGDKIVVATADGSYVERAK